MARRPQVEPLEDRTVPAVRTRLVIDFTPDPGARVATLGFTPRNFNEAFGSLNTLGVTPRFLDFDRDGTLTAADIQLAANAILARVRDYFAPFANLGVDVEGVDLEGNTNAGLELNRYGIRARREQVFVLYLGGSELNPRVLGRSPQASVGTNFEGLGRVFFDSAVELFLRGNPNATPERFAAFVGSVAAHEFGHQLGLGHPVIPSQDRDSLMNSNRDRLGIGDGFVNRSYRAVVFRSEPTPVRGVERQNPFQELLQSLRGQPNQTAIRDQLFSAGHQPDAWDGCGCRFCQVSARAALATRDEW